MNTACEFDDTYMRFYKSFALDFNTVSLLCFLYFYTAHLARITRVFQFCRIRVSCAHKLRSVREEVAFFLRAYRIIS